jgi:hypothetical protein
MRNAAVVLVLSVVCAGTVLAEDAKMAEGLASSGADLVGKGKVEKGKDLLFRAFAYDANCPLALYELGKLFEAEGNARAAADFLGRANVELAKGEKANPDFAQKRGDANRRLQKLNPYAMQFGSLVEDYAQELNRIMKKVPDTLTAEEARNRVDVLNLAALLPKEKLPNLPPPAKKPTPATNETGDGPGRVGFINRGFRQPKEVVTNVPPDVERALKDAGWTKITGTWKKKAEKVYEVTDGKLEANKLNGAIQVFVHKGDTGSVSALVRTRKYEWSYMDEMDDLSGFGVVIKGRNCKVYTPMGWSSSSYTPYLEREVALPEANAKNYALITIQDNKLEITVNTKREKNANYPIAKDGTFVISVSGTATIETPQAAGQ